MSKPQSTVIAGVADTSRPLPVETPMRRFWSEFRESWVAVAALGVVVILAVLAVIAPYVVPQNPYDLAQVDVMDSRLVPGTRSSSGLYTHWLGTDGAGRDLVSAMLIWSQDFAGRWGLERRYRHGDWCGRWVACVLCRRTS